MTKVINQLILVLSLNNTGNSCGTSSKASKILQTIRQNKHVIEVQSPKYLDTKTHEFFELEAKQPMSEGFGFTTKTTRSGLLPENKRFLCPPTIWDMLVIVKELRSQQ